MISAIKAIVDHYGEQMQKMIACEELGELIQEISKSVRQGKDYDKNGMISELADVCVMVGQLMYMHKISLDSLCYMICYKLDRQMERIKNEREHDDQGHH